jgi:hypothetical protein
LAQTGSRQEFFRVIFEFVISQHDPIIAYSQ